MGGTMPAWLVEVRELEAQRKPAVEKLIAQFNRGILSTEDLANQLNRLIYETAPRPLNLLSPGEQFIGQSGRRFEVYKQDAEGTGYMEVAADGSWLNSPHGWTTTDQSPVQVVAA